MPGKKRLRLTEAQPVLSASGRSGRFAAFEAKMQSQGLSSAAIAAFAANYKQLVGGAATTIAEADIMPVDRLPHFDTLQEAEQPHLLSQCVMVKLNGGLGTGMGLEKAKSLLAVKDDATFLDLIAQQ